MYSTCGSDGTLSIEYYGVRDQTAGWYDMPGSYFPVWSNTVSLSLSLSVSVSSDWLEAFTILPANATRVRFKAVAGKTYGCHLYDFAVDDVKLSNDLIPSPSFSCGFEEVSLCGWTSFHQTSPASSMWTWQQGVTPSCCDGWGTRRTGPASAKQGSYYMYTDWVAADSIFYLESPSTAPLPRDRRVTFWYHMYSTCGSDGTLSIEYYGVRDQTAGWFVPESVWSNTGSFGTNWLEAFTILPANATRMRFKAVAGMTYGCEHRYDFAVDDVRLDNT